MAEAAIGVDIDQTLDVILHLSAEVPFDDIFVLEKSVDDVQYHLARVYLLSYLDLSPDAQ